jgi:hypothetical protein
MSDGSRIDDAMEATWRDIDAALAPIIGTKGVAALYKRSLSIASRAHAWLAPLAEGDHEAIDLPALKQAIASQAGSQAAPGAVALLDTFHELLEKLIGPSLTERLLASLWEDPSGGSPAQDIAP